MKPDYSFKLTKKVYNYITENEMIRHGDSVIIGLSGGADSVCLFLLLNKLRQEIGFDIYAAHINHCIRGESADSDELFSKALCEKYDVPFKAFHIDVKSLAKENGLTLEEAGRNARYEAFVSFAKEIENNIKKNAEEETEFNVSTFRNVKIAVAHHMDDQAETVIFNMVRGSGLKGIGGMNPVSYRKVLDNTIQVVRPLICITKPEILEYLKFENQDYCTDETNLENDYSRNQIRNIIIPALLDIQPKTSEHISKMSEDVRLALEYVDEEVRNLFESSVVTENGMDLNKQTDIKSVRINQSDETGSSTYFKIRVNDIKNINQYIVKELIIYVLRNMISTYKDITKTHINDVYGLLSKGKGKRIILPYGITVEKEKEYIVFSR